MLKFKSYAENVHMTAMDPANPQGVALDIQDLATLSNFSYEHIRKIWMGKTKDKFSLSRNCNDLICEVLGLDPEAMWDLAQREKFTQRIGYVPVQLEDPKGQELKEVWEQLSTVHQDLLLQIARGFVNEPTNAAASR